VIDRVLTRLDLPRERIDAVVGEARAERGG
jgi:hypothetical protein